MQNGPPKFLPQFLRIHYSMSKRTADISTFDFRKLWGLRGPHRGFETLRGLEVNLSEEENENPPEKSTQNNAGTTPILERIAPRMPGQIKIFHMRAHQFRNRSGSCSENRGFRIAQVVGCHSENGISNAESCSENTPELSESSENGLFTPRAS